LTEWNYHLWMSATDTFTIRIPMQIRKRGDRKLILAPDGGQPIWAAPRPRVDNTMVKVIARAFRWRKLIETGVHASIEEVARAEKINASYVGRVLRLTLLGPEIIEAILEGRQLAAVTMVGLLTPFPLMWAEQRAALGA
jgi:hypothetical protein